MVGNHNNIGFIRLILASCVIIGHAPEMIDGNVTREPIARIFPTMTLGGLAVGGFFLLSGYLITISMLRSRSPIDFLERRLLRIYPAFIAAFLVSVFIFGTLGQANPLENLPEALIRIALLHKPGAYTGLFPGLAIYPELNGAMWTIFHEFRCYILTLVLGVTGILIRRKFVLLLAAIFMLSFIIEQFIPLDNWPTSERFGKILQFLLGSPDQLIRLTAIYLLGSCIALFRNEILPKTSLYSSAILWLLSVLLAMIDNRISELALVIFGAVPLFWLALNANLGRLRKINDKWDISYGVYLYGWPIATYIRWIYPVINPWVLAAVTLFFAVIAGTLSWHLIERWSKDLRFVNRISVFSRRRRDA